MTTYKADREDYILGAAGLSSAKSAWMVYQILTGTQNDTIAAEPPMLRHFKASMLAYLQEQYGATVIVDGFSTSFTDDFEIEPFLRVQEPGQLPCNVGDVLMLELLESSVLQYIWKVNRDIIMPWTVKARANIRMHSAGVKNALVWIVSDLGATDEIHPVAYDPRMVQKLVASCQSMRQRIANADEPDPSEDDLMSSIDFSGDPTGSNSTRVVTEKEELWNAYNEYVRLQEDATGAYRIKDAADKALKTVKAKLLRELDRTPRLRFPDGTEMTATNVKVKAQSKGAYQYPKIITIKAGEAAKQDE